MSVNPGRVGAGFVGLVATRRTLEDGTVQALGPDGLVYRLVETDKTRPDSMCM